jgi:AAA+ ATPase superfamily predicted ATPase
MKFYNRETEMAELLELSHQAYTNGGLMSVIVGRRRVGKTRLLRQTYQDTLNYLYLFTVGNHLMVIYSTFWDLTVSDN